MGRRRVAYAAFATLTLALAPLLATLPAGRPVAGALSAQALRVQPPPSLPRRYDLQQGAVVPFGTVGAEAVGSCPWRVKLRARCTSRGGRRVLFAVGTGAPVQSAGFGVDESGRVFIAHTPLVSLAAVNCTAEHVYIMRYDEAALSVAVDGDVVVADPGGLPQLLVPLDVPPVAPLHVGGFSGGADAGGAWAVDVLEVDIGPCMNPLSVSHSVFTDRVAAARQAWAADLETDPLNGTRHWALVDTVCAAVEDAEERWVCRRRGRRMADRFEKYWYSTARPVGRAQSLAFVKAAYPQQKDKHYQGGVLLSVVDGEITSYTRWGNLLEESIKWNYPTVLMPWLADIVRSGHLRPGMTFDINVVFHDQCGWSDPVASIYPATSYSGSALACPDREPLDWTFLAQDLGYFAAKEVPRWTDLDAKMVWKGTLYNYARLQVADVAMDVPEMRGSGPTNIKVKAGDLLCGAPGVAAPQADLLKLRHPREEVCRATKPVSWGDQQRHKYQLAVDGIGATGRLLDMARGPGVNFVVHARSYRMMWEHEYRPWVHYIPVDPARLQDDLEAKLRWAKAHDALAAEIAEASRIWAAKHASRAALQRQWALYFVFMDDLWRAKAAGPVPRPAPLETVVDGGLRCGNVRDHISGKLGVKQLGCGSWGRVNVRPPPNKK